MKLFEPTSCIVHPLTGGLTNATGQYEKKFEDLDGLYGDTGAYEAMRAEWTGRIVYAVSEFRPSDSSGDLVFGVTRLSPGKVGDEYFMTRGHIHRVPNRPEIYHGQQGRGVMLLESPAGDIRVIEIVPQTICYVPPYWIHRSVNTGAEDLVMAFTYPADAGQDYEIIARSGGMKRRIVDDGQGGWAAIPNPAYRSRSENEIRSLIPAVV